MRTNTIFRKMVDALHLNIAELQTLFAPAQIELSESDINALLTPKDQPGFQAMPEYVLLIFLNNLIDQQRGKKPDAAPLVVEKHAKLSNNDVLKKLRIAYNLQEQQVRDLLKMVTIELTKSDLAALFRKPGHAHFKACDDELVLDFIEGLGLWRDSQRASE